MNSEWEHSSQWRNLEKITTKCNFKLHPKPPLFPYTIYPYIINCDLRKEKKGGSKSIRNPSAVHFVQINPFGQQRHRCLEKALIHLLLMQWALNLPSSAHSLYIKNKTISNLSAFDEIRAWSNYLLQKRDSAHKMALLRVKYVHEMDRHYEGNF